MTELTKTPPRIGFSRNDLIVEITSDDHIATAGVAAITYIRFTGNIVAGATLKLIWAYGNITFTAAAAPGMSGSAIPSGPNTEAHVRNIMAWLQKNVLVSRDFKLDYQVITSAPGIKLTARSFGANFNVLGFAGGNITVTNNTPGSSLAYQPNFSHFLKIWKRGAVDQLLYDFNLSLEPGTGKTVKNIARTLTKYLDYDIPAIATVWQKCAKSIFNYYLQYGQFYGETPEYKGMYTTAEYTACYGGYSRMALSRIADADHLEKYLLPTPLLYKFQRWFESFPVDNLDVKTNQPQFLYFVNMRDIAEQLDVRIDLIFTDASTAVITKPGGTLQSMEKVCIAVGYQQLNLQAYTTNEKKVAKYAVQLVEHNTGEPRSLGKSFIVNREYENYTRYIIFGDSSGNFKTLRAFGKSEPGTEITFNEARGFESINNHIDGNFTKYDIRMIESDELNTGYLTGDLNDLKELAISRKAFRVFGNTLIPIEITSKNFNPEKDGVNLKAAKIEYRLAFDEENYTGSTGALIVPDLSTPTNAINDL